MTSENMGKEIERLANLKFTLKEQGGPSENGQLFEDVLELRDAILKHFGLPVNPDYEKLLWFNGVPTQDELIERIKQLHEAATEYLLSSPKPELAFLREARETQQDPMFALPELKITTHVYTIFVYEKILLKRKDSVERVLHDLQFSNQPAILNTLGQISNGESDQERELIRYLKTIGVKYLLEYIIHQSNLLSDDDY